MAGHYGRIDHHVLEPAAALALFALVFSRPSERRLWPILAGALVGAVGAFTLDLTFVFCALLGGLGALFALCKRPLAIHPAAVVGLAAGIAAATLGDLAIGAPRALGVDLRLAIALAFALGLLLARAPTRWLWGIFVAAVLYAAVRGGALGLWLTAPADPVTRTMDEALPAWGLKPVSQAAFLLAPIAIAVAVLGLGAGDRRRRDLPLLLFLLGLTLLNLAQSKYQALRALLECCG